MDERSPNVNRAGKRLGLLDGIAWNLPPYPNLTIYSIRKSGRLHVWYLQRWGSLRGRARI